jgi:hypothetical protein
LRHISPAYLNRFSVIRINKSVQLLLPFNRYSFKLSHRLLDSLGGVSRFVLRALADGLTLEQLAEVTGLSCAILLHQLSFLEQHYFVSIDLSGTIPAATLNERGAKIVEVERRLRDFQQSVWLDAFTLKRHAIHLLVTADPDHLARIPKDADVVGKTVIRLPERSHPYRQFDESNRLRTLLNQDVLISLLNYWWSDAGKLIADEIEHWEFSLGRRDRDDEPDYFPITFEPDELGMNPRSGLDAGRATLPGVLLPVLSLTYKFSQVEGFPWPVTVPALSTRYMELISHGNLHDGFALQHFEDAASETGAVIPANIGEQLPADFPHIEAPPGLSATLSVSRHHTLCGIDHSALSRQMHQHENMLLFSFNHHVTEKEAA